MIADDSLKIPLLYQPCFVVWTFWNISQPDTTRWLHFSEAGEVLVHIRGHLQ